MHAKNGDGEGASSNSEIEAWNRRQKFKKEKLPYLPDETYVEEYREFPAGRGKKTIISTTRSISKGKKRRSKGRFVWIHFKLKANGVSIVRYPKTPPILYPERWTLHKGDIERLLAVIIHIHLVTSGKSRTFSIENLLNLYLNKEVRKQLRSLNKRYQKWTKKYKK